MSGRRVDTDEWDEEDLSESEDPHDSDVDDSEGEETIECPTCGQYLSEEEGEQRRRTPLWIWVGIILALLGTIAWIR